jgi:hyperosmotically inducible periplasmic protein
MNANSTAAQRRLYPSAPARSRLIRRGTRQPSAEQVLLRRTLMRSSSAAFPRILLVALFVAGCAACRGTVLEPFDVASAQTAAQVITALVNDPEIGTRPIDVQVTRGVVRLSGRVRTDEERQRAIAIARRVPGVTSVDADMRIGDDPPPEESPRGFDAQRAAVDPAVEFAELEESRDRVAVGLSLGSSQPSDGAFGSGLSLGPLLRFGSGAGLGVTVGFDWFRTTFTSTDPASPESRLRIRPLMAGVAYTVVLGPVSIAPSLVAGYALNTIDLPDAGAAGSVAVDVDNSWAWRPGVSLWLDTSPRTAVNLSLGRVVTRLHLTVVEDGVIERRAHDGHSTMVSVGLAYRLF